MTKMTKKDWFNEIYKVIANSDVENMDYMLAFIDHEIELLNRKKNTTRKTAVQEETEKLMQEVLEILTSLHKKVTITELMEANENMKKYSNQRLSAVMRKLIELNQVAKVVEKRRSYFYSLKIADELKKE